MRAAAAEAAAPTLRPPGTTPFSSPPPPPPQVSALLRKDGRLLIRSRGRVLALALSPLIVVLLLRLLQWYIDSTYVDDIACPCAPEVSTVTGDPIPGTRDETRCGPQWGDPYQARFCGRPRPTRWAPLAWVPRERERSGLADQYSPRSRADTDPPIQGWAGAAGAGLLWTGAGPVTNGGGFDSRLWQPAFSVAQALRPRVRWGSFEDEFAGPSDPAQADARALVRAMRDAVAAAAASAAPDEPIVVAAVAAAAAADAAASLGAPHVLSTTARPRDGQEGGDRSRVTDPGWDATALYGPVLITAPSCRAVVRGAAADAGLPPALLVVLGGDPGGHDGPVAYVSDPRVEASSSAPPAFRDPLARVRAALASIGAGDAASAAATAEAVAADPAAAEALCANENAAALCAAAAAEGVNAASAVLGLASLWLLDPWAIEDRAQLSALSGPAQSLFLAGQMGEMLGSGGDDVKTATSEAAKTVPGPINPGLSLESSVVSMPVAVGCVESRATPRTDADDISREIYCGKSLDSGCALVTPPRKQEYAAAVDLTGVALPGQFPGTGAGCLYPNLGCDDYLAGGDDVAPAPADDDAEPSAGGRLAARLWLDLDEANSGRQGPPRLVRAGALLSQVHDAWLAVATGGAASSRLAAILALPRRAAPFSLDFAALIGPGFFCWIVALPLIPMTAALVGDREGHLRVALRHAGVGSGPYWLAGYVVWLGAHVACLAILVLAGLATRLKFFVVTPVSVQLVVLLSLAHAQVGFGFLFACLFKRETSATAAAQLYIFGVGTLAGNLLPPFVASSEANGGGPRWWVPLLELVPAVGAFRALWEQGEFAFRSGVTGGAASGGLSWDELGRSDVPGGRDVARLVGVWWLEFVAFSLLAVWWEEARGGGGGGGRGTWFWVPGEVERAAKRCRDLATRAAEADGNGDADATGAGAAPVVLDSRPGAAVRARERERVAALDPAGDDCPVVARGLRKVFPPSGEGRRWLERSLGGGGAARRAAARAVSSSAEATPDLGADPVAAAAAAAAAGPAEPAAADRPVVAVSCLHLAVRPGEIFGLLGPNGAGKTTSLEMLTGLTVPDAGACRVAGRDLGAASLDASTPAAGSVGVCPQRDLLWPRLTGREHAVFYARARALYPRGSPAPGGGGGGGPSPSGPTAVGAAAGAPSSSSPPLPRGCVDPTTGLLTARGSEVLRRRAADRALAEAGLGSAADKEVRTYSGGMKRRLSVALALLGAPRAVFLDEPSTGLDPGSRRRLWRSIRRAAAPGGADAWTDPAADAGTARPPAVVLTTHSLQEAEELCDRVGVMVGGELRAMGTPLEVAGGTGGSWGDDAVGAVADGRPGGAETGGLVVEVVSAPGDERAARAARDAVAAASAGAGDGSEPVLVRRAGGQQRFRLGPPAPRLGGVLRALARAAAVGDGDGAEPSLLRDWSVSHPSLEDAFIALALAGKGGARGGGRGVGRGLGGGDGGDGGAAASAEDDGDAGSVAGGRGGEEGWAA